MGNSKRIVYFEDKEYRIDFDEWTLEWDATYSSGEVGTIQVKVVKDASSNELFYGCTYETGGEVGEWRYLPTRFWEAYKNYVAEKELLR